MDILDKQVQVASELFTIKDLMYCADIQHDTRFIEDLNRSLRINTKDSNLGMYNLIVSKRDVGLFCIGMKPYKHWKLKNVKEYFGLKGKKEKCKAQIDFLADLFLN